MKISMLLFLYFGALSETIAQQIFRVQEPLFYEGKTFAELSKGGLVKDSIFYQNQILFVALSPREGLRLEYHRHSDSTFYFREFYNLKIQKEGLLRIEKPMVRTSKKRSENFETFEEVWTFHDVFSLVKHGIWRESDSAGNWWKGSRKNDKREGKWQLEGTNSNTYFVDDQPISFFNPTAEFTKLFFSKFFIKKDLYFFIAKPNLARKNSRWIFRESLFEGLKPGGQISIFENGTFDFKNRKNEPFPEGKGTWKLLEDNKIELSFPNGKISLFRIESMDNNLISLKQIQF